MKRTVLSLMILLCVFCLGCKGPGQKVVAAKDETPAPLQDASETSVTDVVSKRFRGSGEMVNELYKDLLKKQPELQRLEDQIHWLNEARQDSLSAFNTYSANSDGYYSSADHNLDNIKDTVLRARLRILLADSKARLQKKVKVFSELIVKVDKDRIILNDYHETLKLVATLPVIERYQDKNMPAIKSVENLSDRVTKLRDKTIKIAKKYEAKAQK